MSEALGMMKLVVEMTSMIRIVLASQGLTLYNLPYTLDHSSSFPIPFLFPGTSHLVDIFKSVWKFDLLLMLLKWHWSEVLLLAAHSSALSAAPKRHPTVFPFVFAYLLLECNLLLFLQYLSLFSQSRLKFIRPCEWRSCLKKCTRLVFLFAGVQQ